MQQDTEARRHIPAPSIGWMSPLFLLLAGNSESFVNQAVNNPALFD
jgi:hypothetical protein